jgi:hypothetical protein
MYFIFESGYSPLELVQPSGLEPPTPTMSRSYLLFRLVILCLSLIRYFNANPPKAFIYMSFSHIIRMWS